MFFRLYAFVAFIFLISNTFCSAQTITNENGSPFTTKYCWEDTDYVIVGEPAGGTFSGCGVFEKEGQWFFNPITATEDISVFPYQCNLTYTVDGASKSESVLIWKPVVIFPSLEDSFTCNGDFYLHAKTLYAGAYEYVWSPSSFLNDPYVANTIGQLNQTQTFVLSATDNISGCVGTDSLTITMAPIPELIVSNDTALLPRKSIQLFASGAETYEWEPAIWLSDPRSANPVANPHTSITYIVTGKSEYGCSTSLEVNIDIEEALFLPNAFSPNGDGLNDEFKIENFGYQRVLAFQIFNRWGQMVFQTLNGLQGWNGKNHNGKDMDVGVYFYNIHLELTDGTEQIFKGEIQLLR